MSICSSICVLESDSLRLFSDLSLISCVCERRWDAEEWRPFSPAVDGRRATTLTSFVFSLALIGGDSSSGVLASSLFAVRSAVT
jgi:hypothetical protein